MKFIKTKLGLLVMALAFVLVGALSLSPATAVKADGIDVTGFTMEDGAAIRLRNDFNGISWVTTVSQSFYTTNELDTSAEFGVIVAPTGTWEGALTHGSTLTKGSVKEIKAGVIDASEGDVQYRAVINYANLTANQAAAYKLELTARAYVKVGEDYYYAAMADTSRSARQVALAAELSGELTTKFRNNEDLAVQALAAHAEAYYGGSYTALGEKNGDAGTPYIDLENPTASVNVTAAIEGTFEEAVIGAKKVAATYDAGVLTITNATGVPAGENYVNIFTSEGVYLAPVICADKVFTQMSDFEMFRQIRNNYSTAKISSAQLEGTGHDVDLEECKFPGYYLLAANLDATEYSAAAFGCQAGWVGYSNFQSAGLGLTGTFNGYGHYVENYTIRDTCGGLFELICGGTIKNFAMINVSSAMVNKYSAPIAYYGCDPKFENVYVSSTDGTLHQARSSGMVFYLTQTNSGDAQFKNIYLDLQFTNGDPTQLATCGAIFCAYAGKSATNLGIYGYIASNVPVSYSAAKNTEAVSLYCYAVNEQADYLADPIVWHVPAGRESATPTKASGFKNYYAKGAYRASTVADLVTAYGDAMAAFYTPALTGGCFTTVDGVPTWIAAQA